MSTRSGLDYHKCTGNLVERFLQNVGLVYHLMKMYRIIEPCEKLNPAYILQVGEKSGHAPRRKSSTLPRRRPKFSIEVQGFNYYVR